MSITGISAGSATMMHGNVSQMKRPNPAEMADQLFSQLDSSGQGYIEKSDLESALSNLNTSNSANTMSADDMFSMLDSNGDGKVTKQEFSSTLEQYALEMGVRAKIQGQQQGKTPPSIQGGAQQDKGFTQDQLSKIASNTTDPSMQNLFSQLSQNFDTADTNGDGVITHDEAMSYAQANGIDMPAPPHGNGASQTDNGLTQDQLQSMASNTSDTTMSSLFSALASNFDTADTNGDGAVTHDEAMAYQQSNAGNSSSTNSSTTTTSASDSQLVRTLTALLRTYGQTDTTTSTSQLSVSV